MSVLFAEIDTVHVCAYFVGQKIDLKPLTPTLPLALEPLTVANGDHSCIVLFDYGVAVLFGLSSAETGQFLTDLQDLIVNPFAEPETEEVLIRLAPINEGKVEDTVILLSQFTVPILQLVADVLAKSVVLAGYEAESAQVFDLIEPFRPWMDRILMDLCLQKKLTDRHFQHHEKEGWWLHHEGKKIVIPSTNQFFAKRKVFQGLRLSAKHHIYHFIGQLAKEIKA